MFRCASHRLLTHTYHRCLSSVTAFLSWQRAALPFNPQITDDNILVGVVLAIKVVFLRFRFRSYQAGGFFSVWGPKSTRFPAVKCVIICGCRFVRLFIYCWFWKWDVDYAGVGNKNAYGMRSTEAQFTRYVPCLMMSFSTFWHNVIYDGSD